MALRQARPRARSLCEESLRGAGTLHRSLKMADGILAIEMNDRRPKSQRNHGNLLFEESHVENKSAAEAKRLRVAKRAPSAPESDADSDGGWDDVSKAYNPLGESDDTYQDPGFWEADMSKDLPEVAGGSGH